MAEIIDIATKRCEIGALRRLKNNSELSKILIRSLKEEFHFLALYQEMYSFLGIFQRFFLDFS